MRHPRTSVHDLLLLLLCFVIVFLLSPRAVERSTILAAAAAQRRDGVGKRALASISIFGETSMMRSASISILGKTSMVRSARRGAQASVANEALHFTIPTLARTGIPATYLEGA